MNILILIFALIAPILFVFLAWVCWLLFNLVIAKWFGVEGLKSTPSIAQAFRPRDWARPAFFPPTDQPPGVSPPPDDQESANEAGS